MSRIYALREDIRRGELRVRELAKELKDAKTWLDARKQDLLAAIDDEEQGVRALPLGEEEEHGRTRSRRH